MKRNKLHPSLTSLVLATSHQHSELSSSTLTAVLLARKGRTAIARHIVAPLAFCLLGATTIPDAQARITRIEISRVESPTFEGASFSQVGQYEKLVGRAFGEVNPNDSHNAVIADIGLAPRNAHGMVEYSTDIYILQAGRHA
jgi:hypothetical protein